MVSILSTVSTGALERASADHSHSNETGNNRSSVNDTSISLIECCSRSARRTQRLSRGCESDAKATGHRPYRHEYRQSICSQRVVRINSFMLDHATGVGT